MSLSLKAASKRNILIFVGWAVWALIGIYFHEPWRDEAQSWLVASNSHTLMELLHRSSLEATGPLFYFLLKGFQLLFFSEYPLSLQVVSFFGSAFFVYRVLQLKWLPEPDKVLFVLSYVVAFEIANISRLYGWGLFFLLSGINSDQEDSAGSAVFWWTCAILTQLSFIFPVAGWLAARYAWPIDKGKFVQGLKKYVYLLIPLVFIWWHQNLTTELRDWSEWRLPKSWEILGSHMAAPFIHTRGRIGILGCLVGIFGVYSLPKQYRLPFLLSYCLFLSVFALHYGHYAGPAKTRHIAGIFLIWFIFASHAGAKKLTLYTKRIICIFSIFSGLEAKIFDFNSNFSDARPIVQKAEAFLEGKHTFQILTPDPLMAYSLAPFHPTFLLPHFDQIKFPDFSRTHASRLRQKPSESIESALSDRCQQIDCLLVLRPSEQLPATPLGFKFVKIFSATKTFSDESLDAYLLHQE